MWLEQSPWLTRPQAAEPGFSRQWPFDSYNELSGPLYFHRTWERTGLALARKSEQLALHSMLMVFRHCASCHVLDLMSVVLHPG